MADPVVYGPAFSTYARTVRLALEEKGVAYRLEEVDILKGESHTPEHLARQPFGKVPALEHDGFSLYETTAIIRYIDEAFDGPALQPSDPKARARMTQTCAIIDNYGYPAMIGTCVVQRVVVPMMGGEPDEAAITEAVPQAETAAAALDDLLGDSAFLAGDSISLADLYLIPVFDYFHATPEGGKALEGKKNLQRWWNAVSERPSVTTTRPQLG